MKRGKHTCEPYEVRPNILHLHGRLAYAYLIILHYIKTLTMKTFAGTMLSITAAVLLFSACKKDDDITPPPTPTNSEKIVGTWLETFAAADDNGNGTLDESEKQPQAAQYESRNIFNADGTVTFTNKTNGVVTQSETGTWRIVGTDYLRYKFPTDSASVKIHTLNATTLILEDTVYITAEWTGFAKQ